MAKFRSIPVVEEIEAVQFDPNKPENEWPLGVKWEPLFLDQDGSKLGGYYKLDLFQGFAFVNKGDWIIYTGKRRVMTNKAFLAAYQPNPQ